MACLAGLRAGRRGPVVPNMDCSRTNESTSWTLGAQYPRWHCGAQHLEPRADRPPPGTQSSRTCCRLIRPKCLGDGGLRLWADSARSLSEGPRRMQFGQYEDLGRGTFDKVVRSEPL